MGLFDRFGKKKPTFPLPQLCYGVAYFILPHYAYKDLGKLAELCLNTSTAAGPFFYLMACQMRNVEPDVEDAKRFCWSHGQLGGGRGYFALQYPPPAPIDLSDQPIEDLMAGGNAVVLAPHFSAVVHNGSSGEIRYFVFGQAPIGGATTLRSITREGANCNLGPGPEPELATFLAAR